PILRHGAWFGCKPKSITMARLSKSLRFNKVAMDKAMLYQADIETQNSIVVSSVLLLFIAAFFGSSLTLGADGARWVSSVDSPSFVQIGDVVLTHSDVDAYIRDRVREEHRRAFLRDP